MPQLLPDPITGVITQDEAQSVPAGTVVVGYDDTREARAALEWGADWAGKRGCRLMVMCAVDPVLPAGPRSGSGPDLLALRQAVGRVAERGADLARHGHVDLDVRSAGAVGHPSAELVALSDDAALVVVGRRTRLDHPSASLGSVSFALSAHARCPVVVVQGERRFGPEGARPVVVGVDTSLASRRAVSFAAKEAAAARVGLVIVSAWSGHEVEPWLAELWRRATPSVDRAAEEYDRALSCVQTAAEAVEQAHPELLVSTFTPQGSPHEVLLAESRDAGLLVVGARGGGGFAGLALGSVTRGVLREADLPVAVVRSGGL